MSKLQIKLGQIFGNEVVKAEYRSLTAKTQNAIKAVLEFGGPDAEKVALGMRNDYVKKVKALYNKVDPDKMPEPKAKAAPAKKTAKKNANKGGGKTGGKKGGEKGSDTDVSDITGEKGE